MPPPYKPHKFFIGRESLKDVWVNQLRSQEKDISHERAMKEFTDIEIHNRGGLNLTVIRDTQPSRRLISVGGGRVFFLTVGFKDVQW